MFTLDDKDMSYPAYSSVCVFCKHFNRKDALARACEAFPDGIPERVWLGKIKHKKVLQEQQNDVIFESFKS